MSMFMDDVSAIPPIASIPFVESPELSLANITAGIAAEPSGCVWANAVPSYLTNAAWPGIPR